MHHNSQNLKIRRFTLCYDDLQFLFIHQIAMMMQFLKLNRKWYFVF